MKFWVKWEVLLTDKNIVGIMGNGGSSEGIESKDLPANTTECFSKVKFSFKMHPFCVVYPYTKHFAIEAYITNDISILWRYILQVSTNKLNK